MTTSRYFPELYDALTAASIGGDVEWYRNLAVKLGGPVLELGAGAGRTLLPIAEEGIECVGLELDEGMLERFRDKLKGRDDLDVSLLQGDMRDFDLDRQFVLIQIPFRAFLHNVSREDQLATLACCLRHLRPGGTLAFNVFHPSLQFMQRNAGAHAGLFRWSGPAPHPNGGEVLLLESTRYDTAAQRLHALLRYEHFVDGVLEATYLTQLKLAYLYPGDIRDLLATAGFADVRIRGGFTEDELTEDGQEMVVTAVRPA